MHIFRAMGSRAILTPVRRGLIREAHGRADAGTSGRVRSFMASHVDSIGLAGFGIIAIQWMCEDVLMLRAMGLLSASSMIAFNYFRTPPLMLPVCSVSTAYHSISDVDG